MITFLSISIIKIFGAYKKSTLFIFYYLVFLTVIFRELKAMDVLHTVMTASAVA